MRVLFLSAQFKNKRSCRCSSSTGQGSLLPSCPVSPLLAGRGIILLSSVLPAPLLLTWGSSLPALGCPVLLHHSREDSRGAVTLPPEPRGESGATALPKVMQGPWAPCKLGGGCFQLWLHGWSGLHVELSSASLLHGFSQRERGATSCCPQHGWLGKRPSRGLGLAEAWDECLHRRATSCCSRWWSWQQDDGIFLQVRHSGKCQSSQ